MDFVELTVGQVVISKSGRDKGRPFFIIKVVDENYVLVADGDLRRLDRPKLKKIKHLSKTSTLSELIRTKIEGEEKINNAFLRRELEKLGMKS